MTEQWRAVVGYEGSYEVSDEGRVRSLDRIIDQRFYPGIVRKLQMDKAGYVHVVLKRRMGEDGDASVLAVLNLAEKPLYWDREQNKARVRVNKLAHGHNASGTTAVHRLVAEAFIPKPDVGDGVYLEAHHINHARADNRVENLAWITVAENRKLRREPGKNGWSVLVAQNEALRIENTQLRSQLFDLGIVPVC